MRIPHSIKLIFVLIILPFFSGCAVTKDYQRPEIDTPPQWRVEYQAASDMANTDWWKHFEDPTLDKLITIALNENKDLRIAIARITELSGRLQIAASEAYPHAGIGVGANRNQRSQNDDLETSYSFDIDRTSSNYRLNFGLSWELDFWGRIKRSTEAARADLLSAEEGRQIVILSLVSAVAGNYIELLNLDRQLQISKQTMASRAEWVRLFELKIKGGQVSELEVAQVRSAYEEVAATIPLLERRIALQENYISILLGSNPRAIERGKTLEKLVLPDIPSGIPSDLLTNRPDIRQSEQKLIAANARIGVARTRYFPTISLTGLLGYASKDLNNLLEGTSSLWSYGTDLASPVFTGGQLEGGVRQAEAFYEQLLHEYLSTVQTAFREVNDALVSIAKYRELLDVQKRHVKVLNDYIHFAESRYEAGYSQYITVLDAQRRLYAGEIQCAQAQSDIMVALINLYKAMGGGWVTQLSRQNNMNGAEENSVLN